VFRLVGLGTFLISTSLQQTNMAPYSRWVHSSFRQTLLDYCDDYLDTSDRGTDKTRSKLITRIAQEITAIANAQVKAVTLPDDLEKVIISNSYIISTY